MLFNITPGLTFSIPAVAQPTPRYPARPPRIPQMSLRGPMSGGAGFWQPWQFRNVAYQGVTAGSYPRVRFLGWWTPNMVTVDSGVGAACYGRGIYG